MRSKKSILFDYLKMILITLVFVYSLLYFVQVSRVYGTSMIPTYHDGDIVLVDKVFYKYSKPKQNDIVVVKHKDDDLKDKYIIKRIIGIGGDRLEIKNKQLYLNEQLVEEKYINGAMINNMDIIVEVPKDKVFVMGDNRNNSRDSREFGCFDFEDDVVGKVFFTVPFFN